MAILQKDRIILSITKQLNLQDKEIISKINDIIKNSNISNYENIKLLSKQIKEYLHSKNILIKHTQVLNTLSKALGYQNHHSLKSNLENLHNDNVSPVQIDMENDSNLKKLFAIKKDFINKFEIDQSCAGYFLNKSVEFHFRYNKYGVELRTKTQIEINKYLKSYGLKIHKDIIPISKIKYNNLQKIAFNILQHYQSFFNPIWYESGSYSPLLQDCYMLSYSDIKYNKNYLIVDGYFSDTYWNVINNFLDYILNFGILEDIAFFENCDYFFNYKEKYTINDIKDKLSLDLLKQERNQYIDEMEEIDNIKLYKIYDSKYNSMVQIANKIAYLIEMFSKVNQNYEKYYKLFRSQRV